VGAFLVYRGERMPLVTKEVFICAPLETIFIYVKKPGNLLEIWPSLEKITVEKELANGGYTFRWKYKMSGIILTGRGECMDIVPNLWLISKTHGAVDSTHTWTFRANDHGTRVTLTVDYNLPSQLLNRIAEMTIIKVNEKEIESILDNLRVKFELIPS
jgi:uncharacterized membrane protein